MKKLITYFLQGLLFTVPIALTVYLVVKFFLAIDSILPINIWPGAGFVIIILFITLAGYLSSFYITNPIIAFIERQIESVPMLKLIYSSLKDLISAFVGKKRRFNHPVLVTVNKEAGIQRLGFITQTDLTELGIPEGKIAVYLPMSYSFSGNLIIVPKENVLSINASGTEMMKFVISGGVTEL